MEQPRLARPKGCYAVRDIRSIGEQSGRTTGRLGSTGLQSVPSEGRHSWHSGAHPPPPSSPGRVTLSEYYGPGVAAGGWTSPPPPPGSARLATCRKSLVGRTPNPASERTERPRRHHATFREQAEASVRCTGLRVTSNRRRHGPGIYFRFGCHCLPGRLRTPRQLRRQLGGGKRTEADETIRNLSTDTACPTNILSTIQ